MFLSKTTAHFGVYDFEIVHTTPTALGRYFGLTPKWTITKVDKKYGMWCIDGQPVSVGTSIKIAKSIHLVGSMISISLSQTWRGDVKQELTLHDLGVTSHSELKKNGELVEKPNPNEPSPYDTAEIPALATATMHPDFDDEAEAQS